MDLKYDLVLLLVEQNVARLTGFRRWMGAQTVPESGVLFAGLLKGSIKKKSNPKCSAEDKKKKNPTCYKLQSSGRGEAEQTCGSESSRKESVDLWPWQ